MLDCIALWTFPESDFPDWLKLVGSPEVDDYDGYLTLLSAVQADQERQGHRVVRVSMTVATMRAKLLECGWENTPENRAAVVGLEV